jgi:RHS repeat-associated protein
MANDDQRDERGGAGEGRGPAGEAAPSTPDGGAPRAPSQKAGADSGQGQADKPSMLPALTTPKGGGAIRGIGEKLSVNAATGSASLSVPLPASPGRGGFGPQVALDYGSGRGNGPFGIGFALSTPTITRKTDKGLPRYYDREESDEFILSGAEDLVPNRVLDPVTGKMKLDVGGTASDIVQRYRPRVEGLFARIERHTDAASGAIHWEVTTKDNVTHFYGRSAATQIVDPKDPNRVFTWLLEESQDDRGNVVQYVYKAEDGALVDATKASERSRFDRKTGAPVFTATAQQYLKRALYGNRTPGQTDFLFELVFDYGDHASADTPTPTPDATWPVRIDPFSTYKAGFEVRTYRLCQRVLMFHRLSDTLTPVLVRSTDLKYKATAAFTYLIEFKQRGYIFDKFGNLVPPVLETPKVELTYFEPTINDELAVLPPESLEGLEGGVDGAAKQWVDLDGEGIPGVLIDSDRAWFYKSNAGGGQLTPPRVLPTLPTPSSLQGGLQQLQDLGGDGQMDLVAYGEPIAGFATRTPDGDFDPLRTFPALPTLDWKDANLRFTDVDGDGLADVLISQDDAFVWYRSLGKDGFDDAQRIVHSRDEDKGAAIVFADAEQSVQLADMSGDGLSDIVRVRNGEVCYWPNLGYGRFGAKVTLDASPRFARVDDFDARRVRFGDADGSGTSDIFYLGTTGVTVYFNQAGNGLSAPTPITALPPMDSAGKVSVVDLLGTGTATLVWSSPLPRDAQRSIVYVDLMNGVKPHLLKSIVNNLGAETQVTYAPSTQFYLADKAAGTPWLTRLAFPVHVVAQIDHLDAISNSHLTSTYTYHHGFFDGVEREFRGFARVEQTDAESFTVNAGTTEFQPPTLTKSWFHTGAWLEKEKLEVALAKEYFPPGPKDLTSPSTMFLPDTILTVPDAVPPALPVKMTIQDEREAARALRGHMLHQEVYANDADTNPNPALALLPFVTTEQSHEVKLIQTSAGGRHGVFFAFARETISVHTERNPTDPRVTHEMTLEIDDFGNVTRKASIAYGRAAGLSTQSEQQKAWATYAQMSFINHPVNVATENFYRLGLPYETINYELTGLTIPVGGAGLVTRDTIETAIADIIASAPTDPTRDLPYDGTPPTTLGVTARRMIDRKQQIYYDNDNNGVVGGQAAPQTTGSLALPFESYQLALTAGLVTNLGESASLTGGVAFNPALLLFDNTQPTTPQGHYVQRPGDSGYWTASGQITFALAAGFYLPTSLKDPFGFVSSITYDKFQLLVATATDPLNNVIQAQQDYRVLLPSLVTDPNLNRVAVAFDALGRVIATAVMGKETETFGDTLTDPTTSFEYNILNWQDATHPVFVHTKSRETHGSSPTTKFQESFTYSDGFGRVAMTKVNAEPGPLFDATGQQLPGPPTDPRWIGSGRTVFNNKGNPVKKYEPFFSATSDFETEATVVQAGVTPIIHYDALDRVVRTELPNGTESDVEFDAWQKIESDPNDTVLGTTWYSQRQSPSPTLSTDPTDPEQRAAWLAARAAGTPKTTSFDALGRAFLVVEVNRTWDDSNGTPATFTDASFETRTAFDVKGNALAITDARQAQRKKDNPAITLVQAVVQVYDVLSRLQRSKSIDAGIRLAVPDVAGKPFFSWDSRSQITRHRYDELQRQTHLFVQKTQPDTLGTPQNTNDRLLIRTVYGEALDGGAAPPLSLTSPPAPPSAAQAQNLRGQAYLLYDCAGKVKNEQFDFKANLLSSTRRLAADFTTEPIWSAIQEISNTNLATQEAAADGLLDNPVSFPLPAFTVFRTQTTYDALNRVVTRTTPDGNVTTPTYNQGGLLETISVTIVGLPAAQVISNIDYNARGQRLTYDYADPVAGTTKTCEVVYKYDASTFRLTHLTTTRQSDGAVLQALVYTYDPVGNIVEMDDAAQAFPVFTVNTIPLASANGLYRYDSLYRLIQATGREHPGQQQPTGTFELQPPANVPHPNDTAALIAYREKYAYDQVGNILSINHTTTALGGGPGPVNWTRLYNYPDGNNQLSSTSAPGDGPGTFSDTYTYTGNGAINHMSHLPLIEWDYADRMRHTNKGTNNDVFFTYDGSGQRVRKVTVPSTTTISERIYVGGWETFRQRAGGTMSSAVTQELQTLHVMDDKRRVAMVETTTIGTGPSGPQWRFELSNLLDSAVMELDPHGQVITYEEYHPFGSTSFRSFQSIEVSQKRYRYTGKEKDDETGLYYHGARYYAPWLGRWTAADPAGTVDGPNLYAYVRNNPIRGADPNGTDDNDKSKPAPAPTPLVKPVEPIGGEPTPGLSFHANFEQRPRFQLSPPNFESSSFAQGSGIIPRGGLDVEANAYLARSHLSGLTSASSFGLSVGQLSLRYQTPELPGFDIGVAAGGSYTSQEGVPSHTLAASVLGHYGIKNEKTNWAGAVYGSAGYGGGGTKGSPSYSGAQLSLTLAGGLERDYPQPPDPGEAPSLADRFHWSGFDLSPTISYAGRGQLSQGPILKDLIAGGGYVTTGSNITPSFTLSIEGGLIFSGGSASGASQPQSGSSTTYKGGIVGTYSYEDRPPGEGSQTSAISFGAWYTYETGSISGPAATGSPAGNFQTGTVLFGATVGYRKP